ncbi:MAG: MFS transporter, partial [Myxococcota bacterium]
VAGVVLANSERLLARFGAVPLFAAAVAVGVPRFAITAVTTDPVLLVATQALHGINFGAFWLGGTTVFAERAPDSLRSTTQALLPAAAFGAGPVIGLGLATALLARFDTGMVFAVASATSAVATLGLLGWLRGRRG